MTIQAFNQVDMDDLRAIEIRLNSLNEQVNQKIQVLGLPSELGASSQINPTVVNMARNGDGTHSFDTWFNAVSSGDDQRFECVHWYSHAAPSVGQQLKEDSIHSGVLLASSTAIPDSGRSDAPSVDPDWVKSSGVWRLGSTSTLDHPLLSNLVNPDMGVLFCGFRCARAAATVTVPGRLYAGLWDNSAGRRDWFRGTPFTLSGSVVGAPAATTTRKYKVIVRTDQGFTLESDELTLAGAPTDASFVANSVYVSLSWQLIPGALQYDIYRLTGATYEKLASVDVTPGYLDQNPSTRVTVGGYPATTDTTPKAFVATRSGELDNLAVDGVDGAWDTVILGIPVPPTYDKSGTTDKQWLRIGLDAPLTGTGAARGLLIDKIWLAYTSGNFANHPDDLKAAQQPASAPPSSGQGGTGTGGGGGGGGVTCVALDTQIDVYQGQRRRKVFMRDVKPGMYVDGGDMRPNVVLKLRLGWVDQMVTLQTKNGLKLRCSLTHRLKVSLLDERGTPVSMLNVGDEVMTKRGGKAERTTITKKVVTNRREMVQTLVLGPGHYYIANGFFSHNMKPINEGF